MKYFTSILFLASVSQAAVSRNVPANLILRQEDRIVGGQSAKIEDFPYMAALTYDGEFQCGMSIISSRYLITAAHCTDDGIGGNQWTKVRAGSAKLNETIVYAVSNLYVHPKYNYTTYDYDVAIIELSKNLELGPTMKPIGLVNETATAKSTARISGWGKLKPGGKGTNDLQYVEVPIVSQLECSKKSFENKVTERMICAGVPEGGKDSCQGDSGGPMVVGGLLAGAVSWGKGCAKPDYPGVYADLGNAEIRKFIRDKIGI